ncbi:hypothetical protein [Marinoscillum sp. MHG1-6]|uniref:hypothetical protein n=1 Tax=Marinoscillum sp. MHG1-6 TaxID=2959627 RepID=UPI002157C865|nr:hypothetical protein [Marinoscillum sp. MHG1-6]
MRYQIRNPKTRRKKYRKLITKSVLNLRDMGINPSRCAAPAKALPPKPDWLIRAEKVRNELGLDD